MDSVTLDFQSQRQEHQPQLHTWEYLGMLGVPPMPARTSIIDPGYCPLTLDSHLQQSAHLVSVLKISMACWQIATEESTRAKIAAAKHHAVPVCTGGGPFEIAACFGKLPEFLDLCADLGVTRIEAGHGFTDITQDPRNVMRMAEERNLDVQFEVGNKHAGAFNKAVVESLIAEGKQWLDAGAKQIIIEARESASNIGLFNDKGQFNGENADRFAEAFGLPRVVFETPTKASQFSLLNHFGPEVELCNVRLEEILRVEIYRRGIHSDAFLQPKLRPQGPREAM